MNIDNERCIYCGAIAEVRDHVIPVSYVGVVFRQHGKKNSFIKGYENDIVPACAECNAIASDKIFNSIEEKRAYIHGRLEERYKKIINFPDWSEEELSELSPNFRNAIRIKLAAKKFINNRLKYPDVPVDEIKSSREILSLLIKLLSRD